jgi:hypothetical protein
MLEEDSELYTGITDVSHEYPKMFVVRPQFFLAIIALLRGAAQETIGGRPTWSAPGTGGLALDVGECLEVLLVGVGQCV